MDFDDALNLEESYQQVGQADGTRDGHKQGLIEGRVYGSEVSYERFLQVGKLYGRVTIWKMRYAHDARVMRQIEKVEELLERIPRHNEHTAEGQDYESLLAAAVGKMRVVCSLCGEESLVKQGIVAELSGHNGSADLEDGAELAVRLRGGQKTACGSAP